ncbi:hypothetical protein RHGRI_019096 [Rhododendron griersonianum]|uniref:Uncharacterized protein n=1 Tax=Rhododendron griersonianum TaxID=479676 RepID=A0AAV6JB44_9ERIC|nr:hypothetical protein RHGRI_019096 [Rhododendron griersonianum]
MPSYSCVQEGLDHTLRLAKHVAAEIALNTLANRGPSKALASKVLLKAFSMFENTSEALSAATLLIDSKPSKGLRKFLRAHCDGETLVVADSKLGNAIKEKLQIECIPQDLAPMSLGLSHSLSQYKLKFSPDKVSSLDCY